MIYCKSPVKRFRQKFAAESMGIVTLKLYTITKNFEKYGVETWLYIPPFFPVREFFYKLKLFIFQSFRIFIFIEMNDHEKQMEEYVPTDKMNSLVLDYLITNGHTRKGQKLNFKNILFGF